MAQQQGIAAKEGELSESQDQEITEGHYFTIRQVAEEFNYSVAWITKLLQRGRIKGIKPTGTTWRIPASEVERLRKEGLPPVTHPTPPKPKEITVDAEHLERVKAKPKEKKEEPGEEDKGHWPFNIFFKE